MFVVRLPRGEWSYDLDSPLGPPGGFGIVYAGEGVGAGPVAVKRLKLSAEDAAHRELRVAEELSGKSHAHVIPVYDAGEDAEFGGYFVVMARAERSLQDEIRDHGAFDDATAAHVLHEIALGLAEVGHLVHRDLKPGNVLFHEGAWKVADFGIARFVEESTSMHTLKHCLSPQYAAPEQWRHEHATGATDVYALGCIGYALLTGKPPFAGSKEDLNRQHQHDEPPPLDGHDPRLQAVIKMMMRKTPAVRPSIARVIDVLASMKKSESSSGGFAALAKAGAVVAEREGRVEAKEMGELSGKRTREQIARDAAQSLRGVVDDLIERILASAPTSKRSPRSLGVQLGIGELSVSLLGKVVPDGAFARSKWDVVTGGTITVRQKAPRYEWGASLWYGQLKPDQDYRWHEVSYYVSPLIPSERYGREFAPFALTDDIGRADEAAAPMMAVMCIAFGPVPVDDEDGDAFCDRWAGLLAQAAQGQLTYPRSLPLGSP